MKKLNLGKLKLSLNEVLDRSQLAMIYGGSGSGTCGVKLANGAVFCDMSMSSAQQAAAINGGNWCCDSCTSNGGTAGYC